MKRKVVSKVDTKNRSFAELGNDITVAHAMLKTDVPPVVTVVREPRSFCLGLFQSAIQIGGAAYANRTRVKKAVFRATPGKNGFIRTTLTPVNDKNCVKFSLWDMFTLGALVVGGLALARVLMAH